MLKPEVGPIKIACDTGVSRLAIDILEDHGYNVVYWACEEPDEWWFREALKLGAEVFVSADWDILLMADERGKQRIRLRQGLRGKDQAPFILKGLASLRRNENVE